jgi:hypothetical protein
MSCRGCRQKFRAFTDKEQVCEGCSVTTWCAEYWRGECPSRKWWWRELKESNKPPPHLELQKKAPKTGSFPQLTLKSVKTPFFTQKYIIKYTSKMFIGEKNMNFKYFCYLGRCGGITVQTLGSHRWPQPSRLGIHFK